MTPEEIKHTSRKFAELKGGHAVCSETEIQKRALLLEQYTHFLMEDFCIIPKSKVKEWECIVEDALKADRVMTEDAWRFMWERLFGKDTFEEDGI